MIHNHQRILREEEEVLIRNFRFAALATVVITPTWMQVKTINNAASLACQNVSVALYPRLVMEEHTQVKHSILRRI